MLGDWSDVAAGFRLGVAIRASVSSTVKRNGSSEADFDIPAKL
jgi:hypothetical protein